MEEGLLDDEALIGAFETSTEDLAIKLEDLKNGVVLPDLDGIAHLERTESIRIR